MHRLVMNPIHPKLTLRRLPIQGENLLLCGLAATAVAIVISCVSAPLYRSSAKFVFLTETAEEGAKWLRSPQTLAKAGLTSSRLLIRPVAGTAEVEVSVLDENPQRAAQLANALAAAYQNTRWRADAGDQPERLAGLEETMTSLSAASETAKHEHEAVSHSLDEARERFGEHPEDRWRRQGEVDAAVEYHKRLHTQLQELRNSPFPDFLQVANRHKLINSDRMVWVAEYLGTITTLQAQEKAAIPDNHPEAIRARTQAAALRVQLEKDAADLTASLALKFDALRERIASLEAEKTKHKTSLVEALAAYQVTDGMRRATLANLQEARLRLEAERTAAAARPDYVRVLRPAHPQLRAALPGFWIPLLLSPMIGLAGGLLLQWHRMLADLRRRPVTV
jgi:uncharacterized protein involved in exopolysaccharide biosynthesis